MLLKRHLMQYEKKRFIKRMEKRQTLTHVYKNQNDAKSDMLRLCTRFKYTSDVNRKSNRKQKRATTDYQYHYLARFAEEIDN